MSFFRREFNSSIKRNNRYEGKFVNTNVTNLFI